MHDAMLWRAQKVTRMFMSPGVLNCLTKQEYSSISLIDTYHLWSNHNEPVETHFITVGKTQGVLLYK